MKLSLGTRRVAAWSSPVWRTIACRVLVLSLASGLLGACNHTDVPPVRLDGGSDGGRDSAFGTLVACTPGQGFTACVPGCVSTGDTTTFVAGCDDVGHYFYCPEPYVPAVSCPRETWPSGPNAACGPLVQVNGCTCPVCTGLIWTCTPQPCPDAGR
jgi:hypothetical protein